MSHRNYRREAAQMRGRNARRGKRPPPPPIEQSVMPHGRCHLRHRKMMFHEAEAPKALAEAQALRRSRGQESHMEQRYYECEKPRGGCGAWHLTSRVEWTVNKEA